MKYLVVAVAIIIILGAVFLVLRLNELKRTTSNQNNQISQNAEEEAVSVIAQNLDTPWSIAFLPDGSVLVTERKGTVQYIDKEGNVSEVANISSVREIGEGGLLGIALHPNFSQNNFVYLYYTYSENGGNTLNRVVRITLRQLPPEADRQSKPYQLTEERIIVDKISGASNHNGGRIKFGPDGFLYITTGDAQVSSRAQDKDSLAGKILKVTDEGKVDVYSYGHRNPQGLAWDASGNLWETEHGPSGVWPNCCQDEINLIQKGGNFGWPQIQGDETRVGMISPKKNSGSDTWAPSGTVFVENSLFFAGLRGQALYEAVIENNQVVEIRKHFKGEFGRIREVILGPDGLLYITTSNLDGRGIPKDGDDKVIKINPQAL